MTRNAKILIAAGVVALVGSAAVVGVSSARDKWKDGHFGYGVHHAGYDGAGDHRGWKGGHHRKRMRHMMERFDTNEDGKLTQAEIDEARQANLAKFDSNGDGSLSLGEFETLWLDFMRERMVDRFQDLDSDGDAVVTAEEYSEPFAAIVQRFDRNGDGALSREDRPGRQGRHDRHGEDSDD